MNFLKKTSLLMLMAASFAACEKEEEETTNHVTDCEEFGVERTENSCSSYTFTSNISNVDPNPDWYVYTHPNPTPVHYGNDSKAFEFNPTNAGNYTVEAVYKSDWCDEPVTVGFDVDVDEECFKDVDVDCESFAVEKTEHSCNSFTFTANTDHAYMKVDGQLVAHGQKGFDWDPQHAEVYTIEIGYEGEGCPNGTSKTFVIEVDEECFDNTGVDCNEFGVEKTEHSCNSFTFTANVDKAYMKVDGELIAQGQKGFDFDPKHAGTYTVQVGFESPHCPDGAFKEFVIDIEEDCFDNIGTDCNEFGVEKTEHSCKSFTFTANVDKAYMKVDGELIANGQKAFDFDPKHAGTYAVQVGFESPHCPNGAFKEFVIDVDEECFKDEDEVDCEGIDLHLVKSSCKNYTLSASLESAYWIVNGVNQGIDSNKFTFEPETHGDYTILVGYENENCPNDVTKELKIEVDAPCFE